MGSERSDIHEPALVSQTPDARPRPVSLDSGVTERQEKMHGWRGWISSGFTWVEDVVYIGLGLLLAGSALVMLIAGLMSFGRSLWAGLLPVHIIDQLDRILLVLMIVEILYTVQVSFREHTLTPDPFIIVGLIATTRRILILTAEFATSAEKGEGPFRHAMIELGLLTLLIIALVGSLRLLRNRGPGLQTEK